ADDERHGQQRQRPGQDQQRDHALEHRQHPPDLVPRNGESATGETQSPSVGLTMRVISFLSRVMTTFTVVPGLTKPAAVYRSARLSVQRPSSVSSRSPAFSPPAAAAPPGITSLTVTPASSSSLPFSATRPHCAAGASTCGAALPFSIPSTASSKPFIT